jgi:hypothetical protein
MPEKPNKKGADIEEAEKLLEGNPNVTDLYNEFTRPTASAFRFTPNIDVTKSIAYTNWLKILEQTRHLQHSHYQDDVTELRKELDATNIVTRSINKRIESLEEKMKSIEEILPQKKTIILREITREDAKVEIEELFKRGNILYYSDIAEKLRIDLELVVEICEELVKEGKVRIAESS